jgi:hypothetical protein
MASTKRERLRKAHWPNVEDTWTGEEVGWFKIPRTLPMLFSGLTKQVRGNIDPTPVYLELLSHHYGDGFIELRHESEHAFAVGYSVGRIRSWRERMAKLAELGFIKVAGSGSQPYKYILLMHPTTVLERLRNEGKLDEKWWSAYISRKAETRELTYAEREEIKANTKDQFEQPKKKNMLTIPGTKRPVALTARRNASGT